jgi:aminopeptidase C
MMNEKEILAFLNSRLKLYRKEDDDKLKDGDMWYSGCASGKYMAIQDAIVYIENYKAKSPCFTTCAIPKENGGERAEFCWECACSRCPTKKVCKGEPCKYKEANSL